jgi:hypothetical protein
MRHTVLGDLIFVAVVEPSRNAAARAKHAPYVDMVALLIEEKIHGENGRAGDGEDPACSTDVP